MVRRHEIQVLRRAGHEQSEVERLTGASVRSIRRIEREAPVASFDTQAERQRRRVGRPSKAEPFRAYLIGELAKQPDVLAPELLRRARGQGYEGGRNAFYALMLRHNSIRLCGVDPSCWTKCESAEPRAGNGQAARSSPRAIGLPCLLVARRRGRRSAERESCSTYAASYATARHT